MRRAVATCTSPEIFFGPAANLESAVAQATLATADTLGLAMESLNTDSA
jgi:alpha,alpha-trehalase